MNDVTIDATDVNSLRAMEASSLSLGDHETSGACLETRGTTSCGTDTSYEPLLAAAMSLAHLNFDVQT